MNPNNLTIKTQEVISNAQMLAMRNQNQQLDPLHILKSMLEVDDNVIPFLLKKQECNPKTVGAVVDREIARLPKVTGGEPYLGGETQSALQKAILFCQDSGDEFVSLEHLLYGVFGASGKASQILKDAGMTERGLKSAIAELHKGGKVTSASNEETFNALNKYAKNLNEMARKGNPASASDAGVAALAAVAGIRGAALNVRINSASLADKTSAEPLLRRAGEIIAEALVLQDEVLKEVDAHIS